MSGTIVISGSQAPLVGAFVKLRDGAGNVLRAVLTDTAGRFVVQAPAPGRYSILVERIGQETIEDGPFDLAADQTWPVRLESKPRPIVLQGLEARGERRCTVRPDRAEGASRVWEEARKALEITLWARDNAAFHFRSTKYVRELDPTLARTRRQTAKPAGGTGAKPFLTADAAFLSDSGFAKVLGDSIEYYGPDAEILLSDAFLDHHCFELVSSNNDADLIGLRFRPTQKRRLPDVEGTLWIERDSGLLRWLDFRFVQLEGIMPLASVAPPLEGEPRHPRPDVTGRTDFQRLPNGVWIINRWWIRMPLLRRTGDRIYLSGWREEGGVVLDTRQAWGVRLRVGGRNAPPGTVATASIQELYTTRAGA
jgi:hypothetical protein